MTSALTALPRSVRSWRVPRDIACALVALFVAGLAVVATTAPHGFGLSVLVHMAATEPMAEAVRADPDFVFVSPSAHYDGVYFFAMARDPFALGREHELIDQPANRYGHPAYGWLAGLASLGQLRNLPYALFLVSMLSLTVAAIATSRLAARLGHSEWLGLAVAFNPGLIYAATVDTAETLGAALLMSVLLLWISGRIGLAALLLVPLCFTKEPLLAVPVGLGAWELVLLLRGGSGRRFRRRVLMLLPGPALYAIWYAWVDLRLGAYPFEQGLDRLSLPFVGWAETFGLASGFATSGFMEMQNGQAAVPLLAVTLGAILVGIAAALRLRSPIDPIYLLSAGLLLCLGWLPLLFPKDLIRIVAFWLLLLPFVLLTRARAPATAPVELSPGSGGTGTDP